MRRLLVVLGAIAILAVPRQVVAQGVRLDRVTAPVLFESYSFNVGLPFSKVSELTVPVGIDVSLGRFGTLAIATGFVQVDLTARDAALGDQSTSGLLETELRLSVNVIPGNLVAFATGVLPTGVESIETSELAVLGAISSSVIGFTAPRIGSGGAVGGGFAGALPVGRFAVGLGATYKLPLTYEPVLGTLSATGVRGVARELKPGAQFRFRAGLEGPLSRQTYVRVAGILALSAKDDLADTLGAFFTQPGVGKRLIAYVSLTQAVGNTQLNVYGFDVLRGSPLLQNTGFGLARLEEGNLFAAGTRWVVPIGRRTEVTPRVEYRVSAAARSTDGPQRKEGSAWRFGLDVRQIISRSLSVVIQGGGVTGDVRPNNDDIGFNGYRAALHLHVTP